MEAKGFSENEISEIKAMKTEVQHFTDAPKIQHFATEKVNQNDNVYGVVWGNVVREYLKKAYSEENTKADVISEGITYKVLKREMVTVFYDADGNTLFDVENKRLEKEYGYVMKEDKTTAGSEGGIVNAAEAEEESHSGLDTGDYEETGAIKQERKITNEMWSAKKAFATGADKLKDEENQMLQSVKPEHKAVMKAQFDFLFEELIDWTRKDPEFEKMVLMPHKNMERCMKFCSDKAMGIREPSDKEKSEARNNGVPIVTPVGSDMLLTWIREYYERDDKEEVEKEAKKAAEEKKRKTARKKKEQENQKKTGSSEKKPKAKAVSPKKNEMDNQISIFDVMEV